MMHASGNTPTESPSTNTPPERINSSVSGHGRAILCLRTIFKLGDTGARISAFLSRRRTWHNGSLRGIVEYGLWVHRQFRGSNLCVHA